MTDRTIANTIVAQLGGGRFAAMTGAKNFLALAAGIQFDLPRNFAKNKATKVRVELTADDLYKLTFYRFHARKCWAEELGATDGIYAEDLARIFTDETGLDTRL